MIYDEESDRHIHITFEQAMWATGYGAQAGPVGDIFKLGNLPPDVVAMCNKHAATKKDYSGNAIAAEFALPAGTLAANVHGTDAGDADGTAGPGTNLKNYPSQLVTAVEPLDDDANYGARTDIAKALINMVRAGVYCPVEIVICRPFIEHLMMSAIVCVSGRDTGATLFGPADMCEQSGVQTQNHSVAHT